MQKVFGTPVTGANRLNCTANDIRLSSAHSPSPSTCTQGTTFNLTATFTTDVTANSRYDAAFFFRTDGGPNARGDGSLATGQCSISQLDATTLPALNLDGDTCGDLNAGTYDLTFTIPGVVCDDTDGDGFLNLPNCTSWHSNQGTVCSLATAGNQSGAKPDTKSKCVCDDTFNVPVIVQTPEGSVDKTATKAVVTYGVTVTNTSTSVTVEVKTLNDSVYGDITTTGHNGIVGTTCDAGDKILEPDGSGTNTYTCSFDVQIDNPGSATAVSNVVTAHLRATAAPNNETDVNSSTVKVVVDLDAP